MIQGRSRKSRFASNFPGTERKSKPALMKIAANVLLISNELKCIRRHKERDHNTIDQQDFVYSLKVLFYGLLIENLLKFRSYHEDSNHNCIDD
jgi:hypothetical protein